MIWTAFCSPSGPWHCLDSGPAGPAAMERLSAIRTHLGSSPTAVTANPTGAAAATGAEILWDTFD